MMDLAKWGLADRLANDLGNADVQSIMAPGPLVSSNSILAILFERSQLNVYLESENVEGLEKR